MEIIYGAISLIIINIVWMLLNYHVTKLHRDRKARLLNWLEEVPEFWGVDETSWKAEINKWK